jgi:hypothetical protein
MPHVMVGEPGWRTLRRFCPGLTRWQGLLLDLATVAHQLRLAWTRQQWHRLDMDSYTGLVDLLLLVTCFQDTAQLGE